jgi:hypothetical protein
LREKRRCQLDKLVWQAIDAREQAVEILCNGQPAHLCDRCGLNEDEVAIVVGLLSSISRS